MTSSDGTSRPREINITRVMDAPREIVFDAWTDPRQLEKWFSPQGFSVTDAVVEAVPGGMWKLVMVEDASGQRLPNESTLVDIVRPERLVLKDSWKPLGVEAEDTIVTASFDDVGGKTRLTIHAAPMPDNEFSDGAPQGWAETLDKLEKVVTS